MKIFYWFLLMTIFDPFQTMTAYATSHKRIFAVSGFLSIYGPHEKRPYVYTEGMEACRILEHSNPNLKISYSYLIELRYNLYIRYSGSSSHKDIYVREIDRSSGSSKGQARLVTLANNGPLVVSENTGGPVIRNIEKDKYIEGGNDRGSFSDSTSTLFVYRRFAPVPKLKTFTNLRCESSDASGPLLGAEINGFESNPPSFSSYPADGRIITLNGIIENKSSFRIIGFRDNFDQFLPLPTNEPERGYISIVVEEE